MTEENAVMRALLASDEVQADLEASGKKELLESLASTAAEHLGLADHVVFDVLWERERLGTTGVGAGIAIPHGRVPGLKEVRGFFARLATPLAYEAADGQPVDLVFLLLSPEGAGADHLQALACVSRALRDEAFAGSLRKAKTAEALKALLLAAPKEKAA